MPQLPISLSGARTVLAVLVLGIAGWALYTKLIDWKSFAAIVGVVFLPSPISIDNNRAPPPQPVINTLAEQRVKAQMGIVPEEPIGKPIITDKDPAS